MNRRAIVFYIVGQAFAVVGVWMHLTMLSTLALRISESPLWLGVTLAAYSLPTLLFSWFIGAMLARLPAKTVLIWTQAANAIMMLAYALLLALDLMALEPLLILAFLTGTIYAIDLPCKQIILTRLFGDERLMQAIALNSIVFNSARIAGPLLASLFMVLAELSWGFAVNALLFVIGLVGLLSVSLPSDHIRPATIIRHEPKAPAALHSRPQVMRVLLIVFVFGMLLMNYNTLLPVFAGEQAGNSDIGYSRLLAAMGGGSLLAAVLIVIRSGWFQRVWLIPLLPALIAVIYAALPSMSRGLPVVLLLGLYGFCLTGFITVSNSAVLRAGEGGDRARLASVYNMLLNGFVPLGNMLAGILLHYLGVSGTFYLISASVLLFLAVWLASNGLRGGEHFGRRH
ncbi:MFS transporter [Paenibacillus oenotherae]|uniref:MFS transporter n=1 Tax=Paenibacillus oenotherae TaxID=1435645 RepID=A0ABS7D291_9BACL|nr:MFS transporter [Paenibacillus oenotherae]MBW7473906.1 MFS transporter [Paenibacillus oenotherae]